MTPEEAGRVLRPATPGTTVARGSAGWWLGLSTAVLLALTTAIGTGAWQPARLALHPARLEMVLRTAGVPPDGALPSAVDLLRKRLTAAGYRDPSAAVTGPGTVTVQAGTDDADGLRGLAAPGRLSGHPVLAGPVAVPVSACAPRVDAAGDTPLVACAPDGQYQLAPAAIRAADVAVVSANLDARVGWSARVRFTPAGQVRWTALIAAGPDHPVYRQIAVVVDGRVMAAPRFDHVATGDTATTGDALIAPYGMNQAGAVRLAALLGHGPLPVVFTVSSVDLR